MSGAVSVRAYEDRDLTAVLDLLRASLGETAILERSPELFAWKHLENPFGRSILLVAESEGMIVGFRAFMRWELTTPDGEVLRCVRAVDTATHPEHQRRGIFRMLTLSAVDEAITDGVDLVFNTPNPKSGAGYLSMGWRSVGAVGVLAMPAPGMLRRRPPAGQLPDPADQMVDPVAASGLTVDDRPSRGLRTPRTAAYLAWRFSGHPTARYVRVDHRGSTAVLRPNIRSGRRELVVSDAFGPHPGSAIAAAWRKSRSHYLAGWFAPGSPERRTATRHGLIPIPRVHTLSLVVRPLTDISLSALPTPIEQLRSWDFASSDLELL